MNNNLLILGAGQYGTVVKEIAQSMGCFDKISFLDDSYGKDVPYYHEESIGRISDLSSFSGEYGYAIPAVGNAEVRLSFIKKIEDETMMQMPVIISPRAYVSPSAQVQKGCVIEPLAGVHANTVIGQGSYVSMGAVVNHNAIVAECCHIDNNAVVMSGAFVPSKTKAEACSVVRRIGSKFDLNTDGTTSSEKLFSAPEADPSDEWVKRYIIENGHEPTFF